MRSRSAAWIAVNTDLTGARPCRASANTHVALPEVADRWSQTGALAAWVVAKVPIFTTGRPVRR